MEENLIRRQFMKVAGDLEEEEKVICEMGERKEATITLDNHFLTIICC